MLHVFRGPERHLEADGISPGRYNEDFVTVHVDLG